MSLKMKKFLGNLSWSFVSGVLVMGLMVIIMTLAGRFMGPVEYGRYNLLVIISQFIVIISFFGLDISTIKAIAKSNTPAEKQKAIFSTIIYIFIIFSVVVIIGLLFRMTIMKLSGLSSWFLIILMLYTVTFAVKSIFDVCIRGLEQFKTQTLARVIELLIIIISFVLIFLVLRQKTYAGYTAVLIIGAISISFFYFFRLKKYFFNFSINTLKKQLSEGRFFMMSALLATLFFSSDRIIIAKYLDIQTLGIYSAYYASSMGLATQLSQLFTNVFLPATAKTDDKVFTKKIDRIVIMGFVPFYLLAGLLIFMALLVFGKNYPFRFDHLALFALISTLYFFSAIYNTILIDLPIRQYRKYFYLTNLINFMTVGYYFAILGLKILSVNFILFGLSANLFLIIIMQRGLIALMRSGCRKD